MSSERSNWRMLGGADLFDANFIRFWRKVGSPNRWALAFEYSTPVEVQVLGIPTDTLTYAVVGIIPDAPPYTTINGFLTNAGYKRERFYPPPGWYVT